MLFNLPKKVQLVENIQSLEEMAKFSHNKPKYNNLSFKYCNDSQKKTDLNTQGNRIHSSDIHSICITTNDNVHRL